MEIPNQAFTHAGKFHADDVFSAALLRYMKPDIRITRGTKVPEGFEGIVFDIGNGKYDHHQDTPFREDGNPYAAFGLLWKEFGVQLVGEEEANRFDKNFIVPLDLSDNTGCDNMLAKVIESFNPQWDEKEYADVMSAFEEAVSIALSILKRQFKKMESVTLAKEFVRKDYESSTERIVVLKQSMPWKEVLIGTDILFVIYPSTRGGFSAQGVPIKENDNALTLYFPKEWRGKREQELQEVSDIEDAIFCHKSGFMMVAETLDGAVRACRIAIREEA